MTARYAYLESFTTTKLRRVRTESARLAQRGIAPEANRAIMRTINEILGRRA